MKRYALVGRRGDDGGRYLPSQHSLMKVAAWRMHKAGDMVQVWSALPDGDLLKYDGEATRRMTDHIVKARAAAAKPLDAVIDQLGLS